MGHANGDERDPGLVALGRDLISDAPIIARQVRDRCERFVGTYPDGARDMIRDVIVRLCTLATATTGHFIATGETASPAAWKQIAAPGRASADEQISLADITKLYLSWRDVTLEAVRATASRAAIDAGSLAAAEEAIRIGADSSLVRTAKQFDARRAELLSELGQERARLAHLARHDVLTGLPNRRSLFEELGHVVDSCTAQRQAAAVLFIDLNGFKAVNDHDGHSTGDRLLSEVAARLARVTRPGDTVARFGGDEFVVLCRDLSDPDVEAALVADRVHLALAEPFVINGRRQLVSASIGVSIVGADDDPERILSAADAAMYATKHASRAAAHT